MLAVDKEYRRRGISTKLMEIFLQQLQSKGADECVLETEVHARGSVLAGTGRGTRVARVFELCFLQLFCTAH